MRSRVESNHVLVCKLLAEHGRFVTPTVSIIPARRKLVDETEAGFVGAPAGHLHV